MPVPEGVTTKDTQSDSKHLKAADYPLDTKWPLKISDVNMELMPAREGKGERKKFVPTFHGKQKTLVLNATNQGFLEARLGAKPNLWIGAEIVLHRSTARFQGETVPGFVVIEARAQNAPQREAGDEDF